MTAYYNEHDKFAAAWIRELIADGLIAPGHVDERDIQDVRPEDLDGFQQCHFFAGIGGWSYALRLAGWPDDRPVWTGSCPCQPFSVAGKGKGHADERHLWPEFHRLIAICRPPVVFGEQVASKDGRNWLGAVHLDLEDMGYSFGAADLCAAGVGATHIRQRLFWVADNSGARLEGREEQPARGEFQTPERGCAIGRMADATQGGWERLRGGREARVDGIRELGFSDRDGCESRGKASEALGHRSAADATGSGGRMADPKSGRRREEQPNNGRRVAGIEAREAELCSGHRRAGGHWGDIEWLPCRDGKHRPTQPGIFPLAHGVSNRVGQLRGAGNAIVPQVAAQFIGAYLEASS